MKRLCCLFLALLCLSGTAPVFAELVANEYLNIALQMLEEGNPFLERYNRITESNVKPLFPQGMPYFFGGQNQVPIFAKYPEYTTRKAWLGDGWQIKDQNYIYGFDCYGYVNWIWGEVNGEDISRIEDLMKEVANHERHLWCRDYNPYVPYWDELAKYLKPGDLYAFNHGPNHIVMFIGTLRDYGYDEESWPKLAPWLDYPLVIHSQYFQPAYSERFAELIKYGLHKYHSCKPTQGGVTVSLIGVPVQEAEKHLQKQVNNATLDAWYFEIDNDTLLTIINVEDLRNWCWYREP